MWLFCQSVKDDAVKSMHKNVYRYLFTSPSALDLLARLPVQMYAKNIWPISFKNGSQRRLIGKQTPSVGHFGIQGQKVVAHFQICCFQTSSFKFIFLLKRGSYCPGCHMDE